MPPLKEALKATTDVVKYNLWKYFGAMFLEQKDGHWAVSFTRVLGLSLFGALVVVSIGWTEKALPDQLWWTLWGLLGIKGAKDVAQGLRKG